MSARVKAWLEILGDLFWLRPALVVLGCILLAQFGVWLETAHVAGYDASSPDTNWGYSGGAEGARALLSAVASSNIGVAGTTFSITIAALTLASGQMGPRLLRNFIRDARNQTVLGIFLGTFAYALMVLRTVRTVEEDPFVPHLAITGALVLALVASAPWSGSSTTSPRASTSRPWSMPSSATCARPSRPIRATSRRSPDRPAPTRTGRRCDRRRLRAGHGHRRAGRLGRTSTGAMVTLRVRPGDYVPSGFPIAFLSAAVEGAEAAVRAPDVRHAPPRSAGPGILGPATGRDRGPGSLARHQRPVHGRQRRGPSRRCPVPDRSAASADRRGAARRATPCWSIR